MSVSVVDSESITRLGINDTEGLIKYSASLQFDEGLGAQDRRAPQLLDGRALRREEVLEVHASVGSIAGRLATSRFDLFGCFSLFPDLFLFFY